MLNRDGTDLSRDGAWRERYQALRHQTRAALLHLLDTLAGLEDVEGEDLARLRDAIQHLSSLFYLVVLGEFNSGKSAFINGLLGARLMPEGVTPTTDKIHLLTFGPEATSRAKQEDVVEWTFPAQWLQGVYLVDTPGSNSLFRQHEALARRFIHWADVIFFVMAANRAFAETDRLFLDLVREFRSKVVLVVNQIDLLTGQDELERVTRYVASTFRRIAGFDVGIYPVSARLAQAAGEAQGEEQAARWEASGYQPICDLIKGVLEEQARARQTLLAAGQVGIWAINRYADTLEAGAAAWRAETSSLEDVGRQWDAFAQEADARCQRRMAEVEETLQEIEALAQERLRQDHNLVDVGKRLGRRLVRLPLGRVARPGGVSAPEAGELERFLRMEAPERLEGLLSGHSGRIRRDGERLLASSLDHVTRQLATSPPAIRAKVIGQIAVPEQERGALFDISQTRRQVDNLLAEAGIPAFVRRWGQWARSAWWQMALWEIVVIAAAWVSSGYVRAFADERGGVLGWIVGSAVALGLLGMLILPWRRMRARGQLAAALESLRQQLAASMRQQTEALVKGYREAMEAALAPYGRAIQAEQARLASAGQAMEEVRASLQEIEHALTDQEPT